MCSINILIRSIEDNEYKELFLDLCNKRYIKKDKVNYFRFPTSTPGKSKQLNCGILNNNDIFDDLNWLSIPSNNNYYKCATSDVVSGEKFVVINFFLIII